MRLENWNPPIASLKKITFTWAANHSALVHEGGVFANGAAYPARPFTETGVAAVDVEQVFVDGFAASGESLDAGVKALGHTLHNQFQEEITSQKWNWPRKTVRNSGEVAGRTRNIVDFGSLRDLQEMVIS